MLLGPSKKKGIAQSFFLNIKILLFCMTVTSQLLAADLRGRMGVGVSNQLINGIPSISLKIHRSNSFAFGLLAGLKTADRDGGYGAGLKLFRTIFKEPYLNFYAALTGAIINNKTTARSTTGFQIDGTLGSEFHFQGIESIGFSFEFGLSINKLYDDFSFETSGQHFIASAIHFYL